MSCETFASVWDAIEDTPEEAENMKLRSGLMIALKAHLAHTNLTQLQAAKLLALIQIMPRFIDHIFCLALPLSVSGHGLIASLQRAVQDMRAEQILDRLAHTPPTNCPVQSFVHRFGNRSVSRAKAYFLHEALP